MKRVLKTLGIGAALLLVLLGSAFAWATWQAGNAMAASIETHQVDFPVPFPEVAQAEPAQEAGPAQEAEPVPHNLLERAITRGKHLVEARYACIECHGANFGGGVMVDNPALGRFLGPNLTSGKGGVVSTYKPSDWDRIVRHGIKQDGTLGIMPSEDYKRMSDQELSDIIAYIRSVPPVDNVVDKVTLGPVGRVLVATGKLPLAATLVEDHHAKHAAYPPVSQADVAFGRHVAGVCTSCHRADFRGGPIHNGDPSWLPAANLTPHAQGLEGWSFEDFVKAMKELRRPDGSEVRAPMSLMQPYAKRMTDTELQALWLYLASLEAKATGN